jgi:hypothetical protein
MDILVSWFLFKDIKDGVSGCISFAVLFWCIQIATLLPVFIAS